MQRDFSLYHFDDEVWKDDGGNDVDQFVSIDEVVFSAVRETWKCKVEVTCEKNAIIPDAEISRRSFNNERGEINSKER